MPQLSRYRGRIAPSPTGYLHLGHARTFWTTYERARAADGTLVFRNEDLDPQRSRPEYARAMIEDLRWLGIEWREGPDVGGPFAPYEQSKRIEHYRSVWKRLLDGGFLYACTCSRKDLAEAAQAPHEIAVSAPNSSPTEPLTLAGAQRSGALENDEPLYSGKCRGNLPDATEPRGYNWRFRVPDGRAIRVEDLHLGPQEFVAGSDFGDFVVWRRDDVPAYQLAVVADDSAMQITEVVRGADLLKSTARQLLLIEALGLATPAYYHCELMTDEQGVRLAKRHDALSLRALRERGWTSEQIRATWRDNVAVLQHAQLL